MRSQFTIRDRILVKRAGMFQLWDTFSDALDVATQKIDHLGGMDELHVTAFLIMSLFEKQYVVDGFGVPLHVDIQVRRWQYEDEFIVARTLHTRASVPIRLHKSNDGTEIIGWIQGVHEQRHRGAIGEVIPILVREIIEDLAQQAERAARYAA